MVVYLSVTQNNGNVGQTVNGKTISLGSTDREIFEINGASRKVIKTFQKKISEQKT